MASGPKAGQFDAGPFGWTVQRPSQTLRCQRCRRTDSSCGDSVTQSIPWRLEAVRCAGPGANGGEDYELLFSVSAGHAPPVTPSVSGNALTENWEGTRERRRVKEPQDGSTETL